jgi:hypothetical protein
LSSVKVTKHKNDESIAYRVDTICTDHHGYDAPVVHELRAICQKDAKDFQITSRGAYVYYGHQMALNIRILERCDYCLR